MYIQIGDWGGMIVSEVLDRNLKSNRLRSEKACRKHNSTDGANECGNNLD